MTGSIENKRPHGESVAEREGKAQFDAIIVFGEGPIKPILLRSETTPQQQHQWDTFRLHPRDQKEPDFYLMDLVGKDEKGENPYLAEYTAATTDEERLAVRKRWQHEGRFALKRMGRMNAFAAGVALLEGKTERVILSGGKTKPGWVDQLLQNEPNPILEDMPSEGAMMKDVIVSFFGKALYEKEYGPRPRQTKTEKDETFLDRARDYWAGYERFVEEVLSKRIIVEDEATNTLENIALTINKNKEIIEGGNIGLLTVRHHLPRTALIADRFHVRDQAKTDGQFASQPMLIDRVQQRKKPTFVTLLTTMMDEDNPAIQALLTGERRWTRALQEPEYFTYWGGYPAKLDDPLKIVDIYADLGEEWRDPMQDAFSHVGVSYDDVMHLPQKEAEQIAKIREQLLGLTERKIRDQHIPPEE